MTQLDNNSVPENQLQTQTQTLYFAYGSNLSLQQMINRCPGSEYFGLGILKGWRWIINRRGYANIIAVGKDEMPQNEEPKHYVIGLLYTLSPLHPDEQNLDRAEGVPVIYSKVLLPVTLVSSEASNAPLEEVEALVYVDLYDIEEGVCEEEYVERMNRGIRDAVGKGMENSYVEGVLRGFVREEEVGGVLRDPFFS